jgi:hypothetical protein
MKPIGSFLFPHQPGNPYGRYNENAMKNLVKQQLCATRECDDRLAQTTISPNHGLGVFDLMTKSRKLVVVKVTQMKHDSSPE